jgi:hypothetical protein
MIESSPYTADAAAESATPPAKRTLVLAVLAPFGAIAVMASPLLLDAVRHAAGI